MKQRNAKSLQATSLRYSNAKSTLLALLSFNWVKKAKHKNSILFIYYCIFLTVNPEIFSVKIFSDTSKNLKIKNTKIPCLEIIGIS